MECLYFYKKSIISDKAIFIKAKDDIRSVGFSSLSTIKTSMRHFSPLEGVLYCVAPCNIYRWQDDC